MQAKIHLLNKNQIYGFTGYLSKTNIYIKTIFQYILNQNKCAHI